MGLFKQVEGEAAVLVDNGVYKQADIYTRDGYLYAKAAGGFVRLNSDGSTTKHRMRLDTLTWTAQLNVDRLGRLCEPAVEHSVRIAPSAEQKLLGISEEE